MGVYDKTKTDVSSEYKQAKIFPLWFAPAVFLCLLIFIFVTVIWLIQEKNYEVKQQQLIDNAESTAESIRLRLNGNRDYLLMLAKDLGDGFMDARLFQERASRYVADHPEMICINRVDAGYFITDVAPIAPNKQIVGLRLNLPEPKRASRLARETRQPVYTRPFKVIQGDFAFELWVPVFHNDVFLGLLGGIYSYEKMLHSLVSPQALKTNNVSVVGASGKVLLELPPTAAVDKKLVHQVSPLPPESGVMLRFTGYGPGALERTLLILEFICLAFVLAMAYAMWSLKREADVRRQSEEALMESEARYRSLFEDSPISLLEEDFSNVKRHIDDLRASGVSDLRAWFDENPGEVVRCAGAAKIIAVNQSTLKLFKADSKEHLLAGLNVIFSEESLEIFKEELITLANGGTQFQNEAVQKNLANEKMYTVVRLSITPGHEDTWAKAFVSVENITERKRAEDERKTRIRFFESLDRVNRAIQKAQDLEQLMSDVLDVVLSTFDCDRAFLMYPCDPEAESWRVPMERNRPEYPGVMALGLEMPMDEGVAWSLRILLEAGGPVKFGAGTAYPLPQEVSEQFGFKCFMSIAIHPKVGKPWQFGIHQCSYERIWTPEEERLFQEIGRRLADGLTSMLTYRGMREREDALHEKTVELETEIAERQRAQEEIKKLNEELEERVRMRTQELEQNRSKLKESQIALQNIVEDLNLRTKELSLLNVSLQDEVIQRMQAEEEAFRLNMDLQRQRNDLEIANMELESFSYSVSHDLRAPLRSIDGFSHELMVEYSDRLDEEGMGYLRRVRAAAQRMGQLIDDMLILSRVTRGEMRPGKVNLSDLVREISLELRCGDELRKAAFEIATDITVTADARLLRIVLENLLGNAWKFTSKLEEARIEFDVMEKDGSPLYFVRDNGVGFDMQYADKLFTAFQRLHSPADFPGTGVGLAIVQRVIQRHGGRVWAESVVGQGATFYFSLGTSIKPEGNPYE